MHGNFHRHAITQEATFRLPHRKRKPPLPSAASRFANALSRSVLRLRFAAVTRLKAAVIERRLSAATFAQSTSARSIYNVDRR